MFRADARCLPNPCLPATPIAWRGTQEMITMTLKM